MALHRLGTFVLVGCVILNGCGNQAPVSAPNPVVQVTPAATATADVDRRATLALKQALLTSYPQSSQSGAVEASLAKDGFECGPNPSAPAERACLKAVREGVCEINTVIRTRPYAPEKAQVIKICEILKAK